MEYYLVVLQLYHYIIFSISFIIQYEEKTNTANSIGCHNFTIRECYNNRSGAKILRGVYTCDLYDYLPNYPPPLTHVNICFLIILTIITCVIRIYLRYHPTYIDVILCYFVVVLYHNLEIRHNIKKTFIFLGKHSFNIFLFHTIIQRNLRPFLFYFSNPVIIFILFMSICVITSVMFEKTKSLIFCQLKK